nr:vWA domain-containing protein [Scytonema sp. UIC 10036]
MLLCACLLIAALFGILGLGKPKVAVAIALDLSNSTYNGIFNAAGTVMAQEVAAVKSYLQHNDQFLQEPNQIQIFGFGGVVQPLTNSFQTDSKRVETELEQALKIPDLPIRIVSNTTDINLAIQQTTTALNNIQERCRELLLVTDGEASVSPSVIAEARQRRVKINAVVIGAEAPEIRLAAFSTRGIYLSSEASHLESLFTNRFFLQFNSNWKWIFFWLGSAWIALMWTLILPLERWIFKGLMKFEMSLAGKLAIGNALFWTVATLGIIWRLSGLPFLSYC